MSNNYNKRSADRTKTVASEKMNISGLNYPAALNYLHFQDYLNVGDYKLKSFKRRLTSKMVKKNRLIKTRNEASMLEYIIMLSRVFYVKHNNPNFYHSNKHIQRDTGLSVGTIKSILNRFEQKLKILKSWKGGQEIGSRTVYQLNFKRLYELMPAIFISDKGSHVIAHPSQQDRYNVRYSHFVYIHKQQQKLLLVNSMAVKDDGYEDDEYLYDEWD
jgi:hypothetical protein